MIMKPCFRISKIENLNFRIRKKKFGIFFSEKLLFQTDRATGRVDLDSAH